MKQWGRLIEWNLGGGKKCCGIWGVRIQAGRKRINCHFRKIGCCRAHSAKQRGSDSSRHRSGSSGTDCHWSVTLKSGSDNPGTAGNFSLFEINATTSYWQLWKMRWETRNFCGWRDGWIRGHGENNGDSRRGSFQNQSGVADQRSEGEHAKHVDTAYQDVLHRFGATSEELLLDAESRTGWIRMHQEDLGLACDWRIRETLLSSVSCCFVESRGAHFVLLHTN